MAPSVIHGGVAEFLQQRVQQVQLGRRNPVGGYAEPSTYGLGGDGPGGCDLVVAWAVAHAEDVTEALLRDSRD